MPHRKTLLPVLFLALLLPCVPARGDDSLKITVTASDHPVAVTDPAQDMEEIRRIPGTAYLENDDAWQDTLATTIKDMTEYNPSVIAQPHDGAESERLSIRGSGLANAFQGRGLLILEDGIPINMADGEFEFPVIDPWLIKYTEVFPGASALDYGSSTLGGAINFITPDSDKGVDREFRAEGGSFGTLHSLLSDGEKWSNGDIFASASGFTQDGFRDNNHQQDAHFNGNLGWQPSVDFSNQIYISDTISDAEIPGAISKAQIDADPSAANPANVAGQYSRDLDITRIADRSTWEDGPQRIETSLFYTYRTLDNPVTTYILENNNDFGGRTKYTYADGINVWTGGVNISYGTQNETRYANDSGAPGAFILGRDLDAVTSEIYGQYDRDLIGRLYGIAGLQAAYDTRNIWQKAPVVTQQLADYEGVNPRVGLRYEFSSDTQLFTNLSHSFEPPTWQELSGGNNPGFNHLAAQTAMTAEVGGRGTYQQTHWSLSLYHAWLRNEFVNYQFADGDTDTINAAKTVHNGAELGLDGTAMRNLFKEGDAIDLRGAYTLSLFRLNDDPLYGDNRLPGVPEHYIRAEMIYRHPSGFSFDPNIEWTPSAYPVDLANTLEAKGYAIFGARAAWDKENKQSGFYLEASNLLNTHYIATTNVVPDAEGKDGNDFYPGEGRAFYSGFHMQF